MQRSRLIAEAGADNASAGSGNGAGGPDGIGHIPRVSVVMPVYNTARYLAASIESVLAQSFSDLELIIVNDGSTDGSQEVIDRYAARDGRVRVIQHETNLGVGATHRSGHAAARGEFVVIMDSDDVMLDGRIAAQVAWLDAHPDWVAVGCQWLYVDADLSPIHIDWHPTDPAVTRTMSFAYQAIQNATVCIRRSGLADARFDPKDRITADAGFYARLAASGARFASLPEVLYKWRRNTASVTHFRAREQTEVADRARRSAFESLRARDPAEAAAVARGILETFPAGTWFDERARDVGVVTSRDYLLAALPPPVDAQDRLKRMAIEWFEHPATASVALEAELRASGAHLYADLLALHEGRGKAPRDHGAAAGAPVQRWRREGDALAVFVEYDGDEQDLHDRIASLQACSLVDHVAVYPSADVAAKGMAIPQAALRGTWALTCHGSLLDALGACNAGLWCHLPSRHRFNEAVLEAAVRTLRTGGHRVCYSPLRVVYPFARMAGVPAVEPNPTTSTQPGDLLAQQRLSLGSYVYRPEVLAAFPLPMAELGTTGLQQGLLSFLFHLDGPVFVPGHHDYLQDDLRLSDRVMAHLQAYLVRSHFDGAGAVPAAGRLDAMSSATLETALAVCDSVWRTGHLRLHQGNIGRLVSVFAKCPHQAWSTRLGRHLWRARCADLADAFRAEGRVHYASIARPVNLLLRAGKKMTF